MAITRGRDQALDLHAAIGDLIGAWEADTSPGADAAIGYLRSVQRVISIYAGDPRNPIKRAAYAAAVTSLEEITAAAAACAEA